MPLRLDRDIRRVTVLREGGGTTRPRRVVYSRRDDYDDRDDDRDHDAPRLIAVMRRDESGRLASREVYEGRRRRRQKGIAGSISRVLERGAEFQVRALRNYLGRHRRSNDERRGGWLGDLPRNAVRSVRKARPRRILNRDD